MVRYFRKKTRRVTVLRFGKEVADILRLLPNHGLLFPYFGQLRETHRTTEFQRVCRRVAGAQPVHGGHHHLPLVADNVSPHVKSLPLYPFAVRLVRDSYLRVVCRQFVAADGQR